MLFLQNEMSEYIDKIYKKYDIDAESTIIVPCFGTLEVYCFSSVFAEEYRQGYTHISWADKPCRYSWLYAPPEESGKEQFVNPSGVFDCKTCSFCLRAASSYRVKITAYNEIKHKKAIESEFCKAFIRVTKKPCKVEFTIKKRWF